MQKNNENKWANTGWFLELIMQVEWCIEVLKLEDKDSRITSSEEKATFRIKIKIKIKISLLAIPGARILSSYFYKNG